MNGHACPPIEGLLDLEALPAGHPWRRHLDACPRCRTLAAEYRAFLQAGPVPAGADPASAELDLSAFVHREIVAPASSDPLVAPARPEGREPGFPIRFHAFGRWLRPALLAAAAVLMAVSIQQGIHAFRDSAGQAGRSGVYRGSRSLDGSAPGRASDRSTARSFTALAEALDGGPIRFSWTALSGADAYEVVLYSDDLDEVRSVPAGTSLFLVLELRPVSGARAATSSQEAGATTSAGGTRYAYWRVSGLHAGDRIGESAIQPLPGGP
jgi:hypothetical protein